MSKGTAVWNGPGSANEPQTTSLQQKREMKLQREAGVIKEIELYAEEVVSSHRGI